MPMHYTSCQSVYGGGSWEHFCFSDGEVCLVLILFVESNLCTPFNFLDAFLDSNEKNGQETKCSSHSNGTQNARC